MIKKALKLTLMLVSFSNLLTAEILFDLHAQHFSNVKDGDLEFGRYNLPKVYVSTAARNYHGVYFGGDFKVDIKTPPTSWSVTFDLRAKLDTSRTVKFISNDGTTIPVTFGYYNIKFMGTETSVSKMTHHASISGTLTKKGNQVVLRVNGSYQGEATVSNFPKLKKVEIPTSSCMMTALTIGKIN